MPTPAKLQGTLLLAAALVVACGSEPAPTPAPAETEADANTTEPRAADEDGTPKIASDAATFEFGAIKPTDKVEHVFIVKNEGTADLKIERVQRT
jgi:hypothetical protein